MSVFVNGRIEPSHTPVVCAEDQGFMLGLSVFETTLVEDGHVFFLSQHLERLRRGAQELAIAWPPPWDILAAIQTLIADADAGARRVAARVTYSRGVAGRPTLIVTLRPVEPPEVHGLHGVRVALASYRMLADDPLGGLKSTNRLRYVLAREQARARGAFEALLLNHEGDVAEGTVSNVFAVLDGQLLTPALDRGGLGGIVRGVILTELEREPLVIPGRGKLAVVEGRLEPEGLAAAQELFLTNSTGGVIAVREVLGLPETLGMEAGSRALAGAPGPVTRGVAKRLAAAEERDRESEKKP